MSAPRRVHILQVGNAAIRYTVRESERAKRRQVVVTPEAVEVVMPMGSPPDGADGPHAFIQARRGWVYTQRREFEEARARELHQFYARGATLMFRGRNLALEIHPCDTDTVTVTCQSRFHVEVPTALTSLARLEATRDALDAWLRERALADAQRFARRHERRLGVASKAVRIGDAKRMWGSCGKDGVIRVHWRLVQAPAAAMEYVVAHEVAHLVHRHHGPDFWTLLAETLPDWQERKVLLERWESTPRAV